MNPLALAFLTALTPAARAADTTTAAALISVLDTRTIPASAFSPATPAAAQVVPLAIVVENGSPWTAPGTLERALGKTSAIFARCGVTLGDAQVLTVKWTDEGLKRLNKNDPYAGPAQIAVMDEPLLPTRRPVGFLFDKSIPPVAEAYNDSSVNRFKGQFPAASKLLGTFWITQDELTRPRRKDEGPTYSVVAHELTHILGDLGHTDDTPNLMTNDESPNAKSGDLTDAQCAAVRRLKGT